MNRCLKVGGVCDALPRAAFRTKRSRLSPINASARAITAFSSSGDQIFSGSIPEATVRSIVSLKGQIQGRRQWVLAITRAPDIRHRLAEPSRLPNVAAHGNLKAGALALTWQQDWPWLYCPLNIHCRPTLLPFVGMEERSRQLLVMADA